MDELTDLEKFQAGEIAVFALIARIPIEKVPTLESIPRKALEPILCPLTPVKLRSWIEGVIEVTKDQQPAKEINNPQEQIRRALIFLGGLETVLYQILKSED